MNLRFQLLSGFAIFLLTLAPGFLSSTNSRSNTLQSWKVLHNFSQSLNPAITPSLAKPFSISSNSVDHLPTAQRWRHHLQHELLPFWALPTALGEPIGNFPSVRCNDGSLLDRNHPCPEIKNNSWLMMDRQYVVSLSRQIYTYGVAFQMTGDIQYLEYAKAGVDYLRQNAFDREQGGTYSFWNGESQSWEPAFEYRNSQELAYALLGISFYYYLTHDPEVLSDIIETKEFIFKNYYNSGHDLLQWQLQDGNGGNALDKRLVAQLDQLNTYMLLLTPILPEPYQTEWKEDMVKLSKVMISQFYSPEENLFFLSANVPSDQDIQQSKVDFGHTIKAMWMIRMIGLLTSESSLVSFVNENAPKVLERAYLSESGSWGSGIERGGSINIDKNWWVYNELNQFTASFALENSSLTFYLPQTINYWFTYFVDQEYGEVWSEVNGLTNQPLNKMPKQWPWKNGFHSFEHALVGYITASQLYGESVSLHYAFQEMPSIDMIHPYFYRGRIDKIETISNQDTSTIYEIHFSDIR
jgi:mannose/cellobiose epimerase-like protein (N-acyl-D-glucosamine 2-epimerase family)